VRGACDVRFRGGGALSFHVFPAGCQDAGKPVKFPPQGTFRIKQYPRCSRASFSISASGPVRQRREAGNPVRCIYWRWHRFNSDSRHAFSSKCGGLQYCL